MKLLLVANIQHVVCFRKVREKPALSLTLNGQRQVLDHLLLKRDGRVMVSLREISELLGAEVGWEPEQMGITLDRNGTRIMLRIDWNEDTQTVTILSNKK